jgi:hypothetical protein
MVSVFAIGPKVLGFKPNQGDVFLRALKSAALLSYEVKCSHRPRVVKFYGI